MNIQFKIYLSLKNISYKLIINCNDKFLFNFVIEFLLFKFVSNKVYFCNSHFHTHIKCPYQEILK